MYIAESGRIIRAPYSAGQTRIGTIQTVVGNLPDASSPELKGSYGHQLKNIALHGNKLYVSIASTCNACASDTTADPVRGAIYEFDADGKNDLPAPYRNALVTALHGCRNCSERNGHKIVMYPFKEDGAVGDAVDLVTGWLTDVTSGRRWGRPIAVVPDGKGGPYISDDYSGTVYFLKHEQAPG